MKRDTSDKRVIVDTIEVLTLGTFVSLTEVALKPITAELKMGAAIRATIMELNVDKTSIVQTAQVMEELL